MLLPIFLQLAWHAVIFLKQAMKAALDFEACARLYTYRIFRWKLKNQGNAFAHHFFSFINTIGENYFKVE